MKPYADDDGKQILHWGCLGHVRYELWKKTVSSVHPFYVRITGCIEACSEQMLTNALEVLSS
jgi:hypothetical protein